MPADLTVIVSGTPVPVYLGDNSAIASARASEAAASADQAAASEAVALAAAGPNYADTAAGLAATSVGETFAVEADGIVTVYRHDAGPTATELRVLPTAAALASPEGAAMVGFKQTGSGAVEETAEDALRRTVWAESFGVSASNSAAQNAAAFANAIAALGPTGGTLRFRGDYVTDTIRVPKKPVVLKIRGDGSLIQGTPNTPIIMADMDPAWPAVPVRIMDAEISGFCVIPHATSSRANTSNVLVDISSFERCRFDLQYDDNPASSGGTGCAYAAIGGHAYNAPTYSNTIRLVLLEGANCSRGIWLHNAGTNDPLNNPNQNIITIRAYAVTPDYAIDVADTTLTTIRDSLLEDGGASYKGILAGNFMQTERNWFEGLTAGAIEYSSTPATVANNCISVGDQFSGANTLIIDDALGAPPRFDNPLPGGLSFINESAAATTNYIVPTLSKQQPAAPTVAFLLIGGSITWNAADYVQRPDHHGACTFHGNFNITPAGTGRDAAQISPPAGFVIEQAEVGVEEVGVGVRPTAISADSQGRNFIVYWPTTVSHTVSLRVTLRAA